MSIRSDGPSSAITPTREQQQARKVNLPIANTHSDISNFRKEK